jgi:hypothetical protein
MTYRAQDLRSLLEQEVAKGYDMVGISRIAFRVYMEHSRELSPKLYDKLFELIVMTEGPEFELTEDEFRAFIRDLEDKESDESKE